MCGKQENLKFDRGPPPCPLKEQFLLKQNKCAQLRKFLLLKHKKGVPGTLNDNENSV